MRILRRLTIGLAAAAVLLPGPVLAQGGRPLGPGWSVARVDSLDRRMPRLMDRYSVPGVAITLVDSTGVQWEAGYGVVGPSGRAVEPTTIFQAASLGKPVFAEVVRRTAADASWSLTDPIGAWATGPIRPAWLDAVSAADLLSHVGGVRYDAERDLLVRDPDVTWAYSGAGYALLQRSLEAIEGEDLEELARKTVFTPLSLGSMSFLGPSDRQMTRGHDRQGRPLAPIAMPAPNAPSSLHSSAHDYGRFLHRVAGLDRETPRSWSRLTTPVVMVDEDVMLMWGIGWAVAEGSDCGSIVFHWGSNPGFKSFALVDRSLRRALVIFTNGDNGLELAEEVVRILDHRPHPFLDFYMLHPDD